MYQASGRSARALPADQRRGPPQLIPSPYRVYGLDPPTPPRNIKYSQYLIIYHNEGVFNVRWVGAFNSRGRITPGQVGLKKNSAGLQLLLGSGGLCIGIMKTKWKLLHCNRVNVGVLVGNMGMQSLYNPYIIKSYIPSVPTNPQ